MRGKIIFYACIVAVIALQVQALPLGFIDTPVITGIDQAAAARFAPNGKLFVAQKFGKVLVFDNLEDSTPTTFLDIQSLINDSGDNGLLGLAIHPDYPSTPYVYVLYEYDRPTGTNGGKLVRYTADTSTDTALPGSDVVLLDGWCFSYLSHSVDDLKFGPDGALYVSGGEGGNYDNADYGDFTEDLCDDPINEGGALRSQDIATSADAADYDGAILRINPITGEAFSDNPFISDSDPAKQRIIAYGLRNPYRFDIDPDTGEIWIGDNGWAEWEELNHIPNPTDDIVENFGWPCYEGFGHQNAYDAADIPLCESLYTSGTVTEPIVALSHTGSDASHSSTGTVLYKGGNYPSEYDDALFFADFTGGFSGGTVIRVYFRDENGDIDPSSEISFLSGSLFPIDLQRTPDGDIMYVNYAPSVPDSIHVISYGGPVAVATSDINSGNIPLTVSFDASASKDLSGGPITYAWDLDGDGEFDDSTLVAPDFTYTSIGTYIVKLQVTDSDGLKATDSITISAGGENLVNNLPVATITLPDSTLYSVGDSIPFSGYAIDPETGLLPSSSLKWEVLLNHCQIADPTDCHQHPEGSFNAVSSGVANAIEHELPSFMTFRLFATETAWWNNDWEFRRFISIDTNDLTEDIVNYPLLVRLDDNFSYANTKDDGTDIRFVASDGVELPYEIESWNPGGVSILWVKVPLIDSDLPGQGVLLYYGNPIAEDAQNSAAVWADYSRVYHSTIIGTSVTDSTETANADAQGGLTTSAGFIGQAFSFDGNNDYVNTKLTNGFVGDWAISLWAKLDASFICDENDNIPIEGANIFVKDWDYRIYLKESCFGGFVTRLANGSDVADFEKGDFTDREWHQVVYQYKNALSTTYMYFDGALIAQNSTQSSIYTTASPFNFGGKGSANLFFKGLMDEVRIAPVTFSESWINSDYLATTGDLVVLGQEQHRSTFTNKLIGVAETEIYPKTILVDFNSEPAGLTLTVYGGSEVTPFTREIVVGSTVGISAPLSQSTSTDNYEFDSWSDSGTASHNVVISKAMTFIAKYVLPPDISAPVIGDVSLSDGSSTTETSIALQWKVTDDSNSAISCEVTIDGVATINKTSSSGTYQSYSASFDVGNHDWSLECQDLSGNTATQSQSFSVIEKPKTTTSGGGGGGGGSRRTIVPEATVCLPDWSCTSWSECSESNQVRNCIDLNSCENSNSPIERQSCTVDEVSENLPSDNLTEEIPVESASEDLITGQEKIVNEGSASITGAVIGGGVTSWAALIGVSILIIASAIFVFIRKKKN